MLESLGNILQSEGLKLANLENVGAKMGLGDGTRSLVLAANRRDKKVTDIGTEKTGTLLKMHAKGVVRREVDRKLKLVMIDEHGRHDIKLQVLGFQIHDIKAQVLWCNASKKSSIEGLCVMRITIEHFIIDDVLGGLDSLRLDIEVEDIAKCLGVAKKDSSPGIRQKLVWAMRACWKSKDTTTKGLEMVQDGLSAIVAHGKGRVLAITVRHQVVEPKEVMECIGPELRWKTGASKHCTESIGNGLMGSFDRTIGT